MYLSCSTVFFQFPSRVQVLLLLFTFFHFYSAGTAKSTTLQVFLYLFIIIWFGSLSKIRWSVSISKSQKNLCVSFSKTNSGFSLYHLFLYLNFNFLHSSQSIPLPTQSCLVLLSFYDYVLVSPFMWLVVSSLFPHNPHLPFCCVLSILAFIWLVLMALFCTVFRRDSVSL